MIISPLLALALSAAPLDDSYEPNDTCAEASLLVVPVNGQFHQFTLVSSGAASAGGVNEDWFSFDVPTGHAFTVTTFGQFPGGPGVDVILRTGPLCGTIIATSSVAGPFIREENLTGAAVTYQLQFLPIDPDFVQEEFRLNIWIAPVACDGVIRDAFEPNQTPAQAAPMPPGLYRGLTLNGRQDRDDYRVAVPVGAALQVGFGTRTSFGSTASCRVTDLTGHQQLGDVPSAGGVRSFVNTTNEPFLLVDVQLNHPTTTFQPCERYDLYVAVDTNPCAGVTDDAFEAQGNDERSQAVLLSRGRYRNLTLTSGDEDWFAFDVPPGFGLKITLVWQSTLGSVGSELMEDGDLRVYQRSSLMQGTTQVQHHYGNPSTSPTRRVDLRILTGPGPPIGCTRYDMGVQVVREIPTQPLCTGSPDLQWGQKTVNLFGSADPNVGLLWVTTEGLVPGQFFSPISIYVGPPIASPPAFPAQSCVVQPRVEWKRFNTSLNRHDAVVNGSHLVPLMGTTLAVQYFDAEDGQLVASDTVTFVVQ